MIQRCDKLIVDERKRTARLKPVRRERRTLIELRAIFVNIERPAGRTMLAEHEHR